MPGEPKRQRVLIATTNGPVEVLLLVREDASIGRSVACIGGTTELADIASGYDAFVARATGVIERHFGHGCYRLDVSQRIDAGSSWQLGALVAHTLLAQGLLAGEKDQARQTIWATGSVRAVDLSIGAVDHVREKIASSLHRFEVDAQAGRRVTLLLPAANAEEIGGELRDGLDRLRAELLPVTSVDDVWRVLGYRSAVDRVGTPGEREGRSGKPARHRLWVGASTALSALAIAGGLWAYSSLLPAAPDHRSGLRSSLLQALAKVMPGLSDPVRDREADAFLALKPHRALAIAPAAQRAFRVSGWPSQEVAQEKALERCQQHYDEVCAILASNDAVLAGPGTGHLPIRDAPRVRYSGVFNPERIPAVNKALEQRMDVAGYLTAPAYKATAFHAIGILHVVSGAPTQRDAEERALTSCNDDPARKALGGPCYLYSTDNRVVLPLRATGPMTPAPVAQPRLAPPPAPPAATDPAQKPAAAAKAQPPSAAAKDPAQELRSRLLRTVAALAPSYTAREQQVTEYLASKPHKALAVLPPASSWRHGWNDTAAMAEERVLEACQIRYGAPCTLVAVDDELKVPDGVGHASARSMSRVTYEGLLDLAEVPVVSKATRERPDVSGYRAANGPKAVAIHPWGRLFVVTSAESQHIAEQRALQACTADPDRNGRDGPCYLYAIGDRVVLSRRLAKPETPP